MSHSHDEKSTADQEKKAVALSSVLGATVLTTLKLVVGLATGSLGILSEAAHSALDLVAAVITLFAVRTSSKPADHDHHYGHGKIENVSALFETLLLLLTCVWIIKEAYERLFVQWVPVDASIWGFAVILISIGIDVSRSRALRRVAKKYQSQALEADALHFTTDIWSSCVVLVGLGCVALSKHFDIPWLAKADAVAAVGVALIVIWISFELGKKTIEDLLDTVHPDLQAHLRKLASQVPGVLEVGRIRVRKSGAEIFADLTAYVPREIPVDASHKIADQIESTVRTSLPQSDVVIHLEPHGPADTSLIGSLRSIAARHRLSAHEISILDDHGALSLDLHLEMNPHLKLFEAHHLATAFEKDLTAAHPNIHQITTHIEPEVAQIASSSTGRLPRHLTPEVAEAQLRSLLQTLQADSSLKFAIHFLKVTIQRGELSLLLHLGCAPDTPLIEVHDLTVFIEKSLHKAIPDLHKIVIHTEPI